MPLVLFLLLAFPCYGIDTEIHMQATFVHAAVVVPDTKEVPVYVRHEPSRTVVLVI
jgi:hypothetical protein